MYGPALAHHSFDCVECHGESKAVVALRGVEVGKQFESGAELREHICEWNEKELSVEGKAGGYPAHGLWVGL